MLDVAVVRNPVCLVDREKKLKRNGICHFNEINLRVYGYGISAGVILLLLL